MGFETTLILTLASVFGFYMAWNIGANDVANAMGTSVGSKALTLRQAILVAAVFEFAGACSDLYATKRECPADDVMSIWAEAERAGIGEYPFGLDEVLSDCLLLLDGGGEFVLLFKLYLPLNWGITAALAIITFISAWNNFFWPFLVVTSEDMMTIPVGITQVTDAFGVAYARMMALALLAAAPVIIGYLIFQRRVTEAVMISAGVKG